MEKQTRLTCVLYLLIPDILSLIMDKYSVSDKKATEMFYTSLLYERLEDEPTKLWHLSARALFDLFQEERNTGKITYPEEA